MRQLSRAVVPGILAMLFSGASLHAADINVLASTALQPVFMKLAPEFERTTGDRLFFSWGASYGASADALPIRLGNGQAADLVVMIADALNEQIEQGHLRPETATSLASSRLGLAVRAGTPRPEIGSIEDLRHTLLAARSLAFSSGVSGVYVQRTLLPELGIADRLKPRSIVIEAPELVGDALLRGDAEVGLQQMSELLAVPGIDVVGPLPEELQRVNIIAAAVTTAAAQPASAQAFIAFLQSPEAAHELKASGFTPLGLEQLEQ